MPRVLCCLACMWERGAQAGLEPLNLNSCMGMDEFLDCPLAPGSAALDAMSHGRCRVVSCCCMPRAHACHLIPPGLPDPLGVLCHIQETQLQRWRCGQCCRCGKDAWPGVCGALEGWHRGEGSAGVGGAGVCGCAGASGQQ